MPPARVACFVAVPLLAATVGFARADGWKADPAVVARATQGRPGINFDEAAVPPYTLPAVLPPDANIRTPDAWRGRRADILDLFRDDVYGWSPGSPERLEFERVLVDPTAMDGAATLERVVIISRQAGRSHRYTFTLIVPNARQPAPVFLLLNNRPASNVDPTRVEKSGFWPAEDLIARGYGIAALQNNDLAPDDKAHFTEGVIHLFEGDRTERSPHAWGALGAWAWGASRVMDYLRTDPRVDASRVAVLGHSRGGKAALWAGAQDERFALVISNESGEGGAALARRPFGETVKAINDVFPHWFDAIYKTYDDRVNDLPVDQHMLLSLIAPRALYVASADEDLWSDPRGEFESLAASSPAFELYGDPAIAAEAMPPLEQPLVVGRRGYHIRRGVHNLTPYDWARFADFADHLGWKR
jgi:hypothetical protein